MYSQKNGVEKISIKKGKVLTFFLFADAKY
jgi:hypothetical protein